MKRFTGIFSILLLASLNVQASGWMPVLAGSAPAAATGTAFVTGQSLGTIRASDGGGYETGMRITIGGTNVVVSQIGRWKVAGDTFTHVLNIRSDATTSVVATVTINNTGATAAAYNYGTLVSPVTLTAGATYWVTSTETTGQDQFYSYDTTVTTTAVASVLGAIYCLSDGSGSGNQGGAGNSYGPLSLKYTSP